MERVALALAVLAMIGCSEEVALRGVDLASHDRLFLLDHGKGDLAVVGVRAGGHDFLQHLVRQRLVGHDRDLALRQIVLGDVLPDQQRALERIP